MNDPHSTKPRINWAPTGGCIPTGYGYAVYSNCIVNAQDQSVWGLRVADTLCMGSEWAFNEGDELLDNFDFRMLESSYFSSLKYEEVQSQDVPEQILRKWLARVKNESEKSFMKEVKEEHINDLLLMAKHEESLIIPNSEVHAVIIAISEGIQSRMENYSLPLVERFLPLIRYATDMGLITPHPKLLTMLF